MASELPDEMLHEILLPMFSVPDDKFASTENQSPFSSVFQSSSEMLLVCKRWLRVAYPIFYRTAVIRSSGQAQALADTLKANKDLGKYIKKLRLEGGYGTAIHTILTSAPNITDLYLSLIIWSDDSVSGLCRSLTAINPSRVVLYDVPFQAKFNAKACQLAVKLCKCIPCWSNLIIFHFPYFVFPPDTYSDTGDDAPSVPTEERSKLIAEALQKAPNLEIVSSPPGHWLPRDLVTISKNPSLKTIQITSLCDGIGGPFLGGLKLETNARLQALVSFHEVTEHPGENKPPIFSPSSLLKLETAPMDIQDNIWSEILAFALYVNVGPIYEMDVLATAIKDWRRTLLFVSKTFHRLALPHFYNHPIILNRRALHLFSERLVNDTALGLHVRSLFLWIEQRDESDTEVDERPDTDNKAILDIISRVPRLRRVYGADLRGDIRSLLFLIGGSSLSWEAFCLIADIAGPSFLELENIHIDEAGILSTPCPLYSFTALRSLFWNCGTEFNVDEGAILWDCFPCLQSLQISRCHWSFLELLMHTDLPVLSRFAFTALADKGLENMVKRHGHKLYELRLDRFHGLSVFDLCPALNVLEFSAFAWDFTSTSLIPNQKHLSLAKIAITFDTVSFGIVPYDEFFANLNRTDFPALRELSADACIWTTDEREISKNPWVARSEALLRSGITLTDKDGQPWRPRLKKLKR